MTGNRLKLAIEVGGSLQNNLGAIIEWVQSAERLGVESVWCGEAWWGDAVSLLAYLAGKTERIRLGTGIMQTTTRVPAMTAMTALSLNDISDGRFILGLGASGPQVVEGLHGVAYEAPLTRMRETIEICRMIFAGERVRYDGKVFQLPLAGGEGKALRVAHEPVEIPIYLATLAPKALKYTGAAADGWLGTSFSPNHPDAHFSFIDEGLNKAGRAMTDIDRCASVRVEIGEDVEEMIERRRKAVTFNMGGMGSATTNFYNDAFRRAGFEDDAKAIQSLWVAGKRDEAAQRVPDTMITQFQAIGTRDMVRDRLQTYQDSGINTIKLGLDGVQPGAPRLELLENIADLVEGLS